MAKKLWIKSAGRREYGGCNKLLYRDALTEQEMDTSYGAHIYQQVELVQEAVRGKRLE